MAVICGVIAPKQTSKFRHTILNSMCAELRKTGLRSHQTDLGQAASIICFEHPNLNNQLQQHDYVFHAGNGSWFFGDISLYNRDEFKPAAAQSDIEIIAHHLIKNGDLSLGNIIGDFCLFQFNETDQEILFYRDTAGFKSVYYAKTDFGIVFSSVVQPIAAVPGFECELSAQSLASFLVIQHSGKGKTYYDNIHEVPVASICRLPIDGIVSFEKYWTPKADIKIAQLSYDEQLNLLSAELNRAVLSRLDPEHGKTAVQLSGGLDSSTIAGVICAGKPADQFLAISNVLPDDYSGDATDEREYIQQVGEKWPNLSVQFVTDEGTELFGADSLWHDWFLAPNPDLFHNVNQVIDHAMAKSGRRVLLTGFGGDEAISAWGLPALTEFVLAGKFVASRNELRRLLSRYPNSSTFKIILSKVLIPFLPKPIRYLAKSLRKTRWQDEYPLSSEFKLSKDFAAHLAENGVEDAPEAHKSMFDYEVSNLSAFDSYNLPVYDFAANLLGYRVRHPFLDHRLLDCVLSMPVDLKVSADRDRMLLRTVAANLLPAQIRHRNDKKSFYPGFLDRAADAIEMHEEGHLHAGTNLNWDRIVERNTTKKFKSGGECGRLPSVIKRLQLQALANFLNRDSEHTIL